MLKPQTQRVDFAISTCCLFLAHIDVWGVRVMNSHELKNDLHPTPGARNALTANRIHGCRLGVDAYTRVYHCSTNSYRVAV